jgi:saxitoxin biosynthesis operon SxtJ-like protein
MKPQSQKQLRNFGVTVGAIFGVIGLWPTIVRGGDPRLWALAVSAALVLPGLLAPRTLRPVYRVWMALGDALNWVNTRIILGVIFYGLITPLGVTRRRFGDDPMRRRPEPGADTYRVLSRPRRGAHMTRQF